MSILHSWTVLHLPLHRPVLLLQIFDKCNHRTTECTRYTVFATQPMKRARWLIHLWRRRFWVRTRWSRRRRPRNLGIPERTPRTMWRVLSGFGVFQRSSTCSSQIFADFYHREGGQEHHRCLRFRKSVHGSIDAPRAWWERVETDMNKLKWRTLTPEPCFWVMTSVTGRIEGLAVAYVDDFMVAIHEEFLVGQRDFSDVKALYEWRGTQCGVHIGIRIAGLVFLCLVHITRNRWFSWSCHRQDEKQSEDLVTAKELAGLRGLRGQLMWLATQVVPQLQAPLSLLLGYLGVATVSTLLEANNCKTGIGLGSDASSHLRS